MTFCFCYLKQNYFGTSLKFLQMLLWIDAGSLRWDAFSLIAIPCPPLQEQQAIAAILTTAGEEIVLLEAKFGQLKEQKKGLMQKLLTGEVRVQV